MFSVARARHVVSLFLQALEEYEMIRDGDRVMVCLSGGKDSLSLLHALHQYQFYARSKVSTLPKYQGQS